MEENISPIKRARVFVNHARAPPLFLLRNSSLFWVGCRALTDPQKHKIRNFLKKAFKGQPILLFLLLLYRTGYRPRSEQLQPSTTQCAESNGRGHRRPTLRPPPLHDGEEKNQGIIKFFLFLMMNHSTLYGHHSVIITHKEREMCGMPNFGARVYPEGGAHSKRRKVKR